MRSCTSTDCALDTIDCALAGAVSCGRSPVPAVARFAAAGADGNHAHSRGLNFLEVCCCTFIDCPRCSACGVGTHTRAAAAAAAVGGQCCLPLTLAVFLLLPYRRTMCRLMWTSAAAAWQPTSPTWWRVRASLILYCWSAPGPHHLGSSPACLLLPVKEGASSACARRLFPEPLVQNKSIEGVNRLPQVPPSR